MKGQIRSTSRFKQASRESQTTARPVLRLDQVAFRFYGLGRKSVLSSRRAGEGPRRSRSMKEPEVHQSRASEETHVVWIWDGRNASNERVL